MFDALIRTYNSGRTLERTLMALELQESSPSTIIVVDSGSRDDTLEIARRHGCLVIAYPSEPFSFAKALNIGLTAVRSARCLVISSHVELRDPTITARLLHAVDNETTPAAYINYLEPDGFRAVIDGTSFTGWNGLWNPCAMYRTDVAKALGFDEAVPSAEDQHFAKRLYERGYGTVAIGSSQLSYSNPNTNRRKARNEYVSIAFFVRPELLRAKNIASMFAQCAKLTTSFQWESAIDRGILGVRLIAARFRKPRFKSKYFGAAPRTRPW